MPCYRILLSSLNRTNKHLGNSTTQNIKHNSNKAPFHLGPLFMSVRHASLARKPLSDNFIYMQNRDWRIYLCYPCSAGGVIITVHFLVVGPKLTLECRINGLATFLVMLDSKIVFRRNVICLTKKGHVCYPETRPG